ncbi:MAG: sulfite exporter TauE/SafE family protein [Vicinamibacterales bacterium]
MHEHVHAVATAAGSHLDLVAFLMLGVLGSAAHCVGMCTPFVFMVSRRYALPAGAHIPWVAQAWYHAGRFTTYGLLGALGGALGAAVQVAGALVGLQRVAAMLAGAALVVTGVTSLLSLAPAGGPGAWASRLTATLGRRMPGHPFALGLVLGLLPCGLLYSAVVAAMATGSAVNGAAGVVLFGLGTSPALVGVSLADALFVRRRAVLNRLAQVFVVVMGAWFVWRAVLPVS